MNIQERLNEFMRDSTGTEYQDSKALKTSAQQIEKDILELLPRRIKATNDYYDKGFDQALEDVRLKLKDYFGEKR